MLLVNEMKYALGAACVYVISNKATSAYKIGWTGQQIDRRVSQVRTETGRRKGVELEFTVPCKSHSAARALEYQLHLEFASKRIQGEWFALTEQDLDRIWAFCPVRPSIDSLSVKEVLAEFRRVDQYHSWKAKRSHSPWFSAINKRARIVRAEYLKEIEVGRMILKAKEIEEKINRFLHAWRSDPSTATSVDHEQARAISREMHQMLDELDYKWGIAE